MSVQDCELLGQLDWRGGKLVVPAKTLEQLSVVLATPRSGLTSREDLKLNVFQQLEPDSEEPPVSHCCRLSEAPDGSVRLRLPPVFVADILDGARAYATLELLRQGMRLYIRAAANQAHRSAQMEVENRDARQQRRQQDQELQEQHQLQEQESPRPAGGLKRLRHGPSTSPTTATAPAAGTGGSGGGASPAAAAITVAEPAVAAAAAETTTARLHALQQQQPPDTVAPMDDAGRGGSEAGPAATATPVPGNIDDRLLLTLENPLRKAFNKPRLCALFPEWTSARLPDGERQAVLPVRLHVAIPPEGGCHGPALERAFDAAVVKRQEANESCYRIYLDGLKDMALELGWLGALVSMRDTTCIGNAGESVACGLTDCCHCLRC